MESTEISPEYQPPIDFQPPPPGEIEEEMMLAILNGIGIPGERRPLSASRSSNRCLSTSASRRPARSGGCSIRM